MAGLEAPKPGWHGQAYSLARAERAEFHGAQARASVLAHTTQGFQTEPNGFTGIELRVPVFQVMSDRQLSLLEQEREAAEEELRGLMERLRTRLGSGAVGRARLVESYIPERAFGMGECGEDGPGNDRQECLSYHMMVRPMRLLALPVALKTVVSLRGEGWWPILFNYRREVHRLMHVRGPERINGVWWERSLGRDKTRDYFDVEDEEGRRFWMFRVVETGGWYLHGLF